VLHTLANSLPLLPIFRYPYFGVYTAVFRAVFHVLRKNFAFFMLILIRFSESQMETTGILARIAVNKPKNAVLREPYFIGGGK
jgi:hypothetical protein